MQVLVICPVCKLYVLTDKGSGDEAPTPLHFAVTDYNGLATAAKNKDHTYKRQLPPPKGGGLSPAGDDRLVDFSPSKVHNPQRHKPFAKSKLGAF